MSTVAENFLRKFSNSKSKKTYKKSAKDCLIELKDFIKESSQEYVGRKYSIEHLIGSILKDDKRLTENELSAFFKCNLVAAEFYFSQLCEEIQVQEGELNFYSIKKYSNKFKNFLFDFKPVIEYFKQKDDANYRFFGGAKTYLHHTFELYITYKRLFWANDSDIDIYDKTKLNLACFTLRQSIELKLMRIFGLYEFYNKTFDGPKVGSDFFVDFISEESKYIIFEDLKFSTLKQVYKWTNLTIHSATIPRSWELYLAIKYADKLLEPETYKNRKGRSGYSVAGKIKVNIFKRLQNELFEKLYLANDKDFVCVDLKEPESEILSYT